jgi:DNA primase
LWTQLPDGALKRQLLSEIAELVQLANRELADLWTPKTFNSNVERSNSPQYRSSFGIANRFHDGNSVSMPSKLGRPSSRKLPTSRADHAVRILLGDMASLEVLSAEDHAVLCGLPPPHGPLFVWLEGQLHEHGPQPWVALREGLRGLQEENIAVPLMTGFELNTAVEKEESMSELRNLLNRMLVDRLKAQETETIQAAKADPTALQRYREIQTRRLELEHALAQSN